MFSFHLHYLADRLLRKTPFYSGPKDSGWGDKLAVYDFENTIIPALVPPSAQLAREYEHLCRTTLGDGFDDYADAARNHFQTQQQARVILSANSLTNVDYGLAVLSMDVQDFHVISLFDMQRCHHSLQYAAMCLVGAALHTWGPSRWVLLAAWALLIFLGGETFRKSDVLGFYMRLYGYPGAVFVGHSPAAWKDMRGSGMPVTVVEVPSNGLFGQPDKVEEINDLLNLN